MDYRLLISTDELANHVDEPDWMVVDCRFTLSKPDEKEALYQRAHIPGAIYAHLNRDLSAEIIPGKTGRHPMPAPEETARRFGEMGIGNHTQVIAYDDQGGSLAAVRLWWMLRWLGHDSVAVLDGGWQKWLNEDRPVRNGWEIRQPQAFKAKSNPIQFALADEADRIRLDSSYRLVDARAPERYSGAVEPIDPIAGHIPGAINIPYTKNLTEDGVFRSADELRDFYSKELMGVSSDRVVFYCGSGVTSIHSVLALMAAGIGEAKFYAGSWSEWITDRSRPIAIGPNPFEI